MNETEKQIVVNLVDRLLEKGYRITVTDEVDTIGTSTDIEKILEMSSNAKEITYVVYDNELKLGWILLIWGNDEDVISDYGGNKSFVNFLDNIIDGA